jgi:hypothetical protein
MAKPVALICVRCGELWSPPHVCDVLYGDTMVQATCDLPSGVQPSGDRSGAADAATLQALFGAMPAVPFRPASPDQTLARIDATLEDWEDGEDAAQWCANGGPDELGELAEDEDECDGMLGACPTLVIFDEVRCWDAADSL